MTEVHVASWNIHGGLDRGGQSFDYWRILDNYALDVAAIQELQVSLEGKVPESCRESALKMGLTDLTHHAFSLSPFDSGNLLAVALATKRPQHLTDVREFTNPSLMVDGGEGLHDKGALRSVLRFDDGTEVDVLSVHLFPFRRLRVDEAASMFNEVWDDIDRAIAPTPGIPRIVMGDFNSENRGVILPSLQNSSLTSVFDGIATRPNGAAHDDILISPEWTVLDAGVVETASDHHLLWARLRLVAP